MCKFLFLMEIIDNKIFRIFSHLCATHISTWLLFYSNIQLTDWMFTSTQETISIRLVVRRKKNHECSSPVKRSCIPNADEHISHLDSAFNQTINSNYHQSLCCSTGREWKKQTTDIVNNAPAGTEMKLKFNWKLCFAFCIVARCVVVSPSGPAKKGKNF